MASVESSSRCDALFLSPHPDDVELFCGATVAAMAASGRDIVIVDLTRGELSSNGTVEERRSASLQAARLLGARAERPVLGLPDGGVDPHDEAQVRTLVGLIRGLRPRLLVAPWTRDRHPDHEATGEMARRAHFLAGVRLFAPETGAAFRPQQMLFFPSHHDVDADVVVPVDAGMVAWRAAVDQYTSQFRRDAGRTPTVINAPGFVEGQIARRREWGRRIGVEHAEVFVSEGPWIVRADRLVDTDPESSFDQETDAS